MANYRIFEMEEAPIDRNKDGLNAYDVADSSFAEHTAERCHEIEEEDIEGCIEDLVKALSKACDVSKEYGAEGEQIVFRLKENGREEYFAERFADFKEYVAGLSLAEFCEPAISTLKWKVTDTNDDHVFFNGWYLCLDSFVRRMQKNKTYYLGGIVGFEM